MYEDIGSDLGGQIEFNDEDMEVEEDEDGEHADRVGLLAPSPLIGGSSRANSSANNEARPEFTYCTPVRVHAILPPVRVLILHIPLRFANVPTP